MKFKPLLYSIHRWLGIGMCLLFALWFASGIIMMYVEYPELTEEERIANLPWLKISQVTLSPFEAASFIGSESVYSSVSLSTVLDRPAYQLRAIDGVLYTVFADTGEVFQGTDSESAVLAGQTSGFTKRGVIASYDKAIVMDQWTLSAGLNNHRPLHRVKLDDDRGSILYISEITAQVVRDTNRNERFWNWLGSTIHWIYPLQLRQHATLWNDVIVYLSVAGIISVVTGGIIGLMRIRVRKPYRGSNYSPYRGWMKWHHLLGLLSLVFVATFIFSGLMSMGPWGVFSSQSSAQTQIDRYSGGGEFRLSNLPMPNFAELVSPIKLDSSVKLDSPVKEVQWHKIRNTPYYSLISSLNQRRVGFAANTSPNDSLVLLGKITEAVPQLLPDAKLLSLEMIRQPDDYYYSRHNRYRPFPVYRAVFDDAESTWYHIDLVTGEIVSRVTDASRRERWLYNGLHSLDFQLLLRHRPLWDVVLIILSLLGLGFSISSVVVGWRRLFN